MAGRVEEGPLQLGTRFLDKYEIRGRLGHGGQAWVYLGQHIFTAREVAIKVIHSPRGVTREMLMRGKSEARALGKLDHTNIVIMHDAGVTDDGLFYIIMELLRGQSLREVLATRPRLSVEEVLRLAIQVGEAVQAAHEVQMIHRDLKPDNVYLTKGNRLKVLDFGIAKMLNEIGFTTRQDIVIGSLLYMSPEQVQGQPATAQSDIFALGLMMFEALIGKHPSLLIFERDLDAQKEPHRRATLADIPTIQVNRMPPLLSDLDPEIPNYVAQVVQRAIARASSGRSSSMRDFVSALSVCLECVRKELPSGLATAETRDLSLPVLAQLDAPSSERATLKRESSRDAVDLAAPSAPATIRSPVSVATAPFGGEWAQASVSPRALSWPPKPVSSPPTTTDSRGPSRRRALLGSALVTVRNALVGGCLFGFALGTVGALMYFGTARPASPRAPAAIALAALVPNSQVAFPPAPAVPSMAEPAQLGELQADSSAPPTLVPRVVPSPALAARATRRTPHTALGRPSANEARAKLINGGKLIYGD